MVDLEYEEDGERGEQEEAKDECCSNQGAERFVGFLASLVIGSKEGGSERTLRLYEMEAVNIQLVGA